MIKKIIDAVSVAINAEFGDEYEIYTENLEQGLTEPCFSILCLNPSIEKFLGNKYNRIHPFCIQYFPSSSEKNAECFDVQERLMNCLEYITVGADLTSGTKMKGQVTSGVLNFFVNYDLFVYKVESEADHMETLTVDPNVKG